MPEVRRVPGERFRVYSPRRVWHQLHREGVDLARCTADGLMRRFGIQGAVRGKPQRTTTADPTSPCPLDKVNRQFRAPAPNTLWVRDFTHVSTWQGIVHVAFVIDLFANRIVGWRASRSQQTQVVHGARDDALNRRFPSAAPARV